MNIIHFSTKTHRKILFLISYLCKKRIKKRSLYTFPHPHVTSCCPYCTVDCRRSEVRLHAAVSSGRRLPYLTPLCIHQLYGWTKIRSVYFFQYYYKRVLCNALRSGFALTTCTIMGRKNVPPSNHLDIRALRLPTLARNQTGDWLVLS